MRPSLNVFFAILIFVTLSSCSHNTQPPPVNAAKTGIHFERVRIGDVSYVVARLDLKQARLTLKWKDQHGQGYGSFEKVIQASAPQRVVFATNAGIFDPSHTPCGWYVEDGKESVPLNLQDGEGNFYMKPNGIFKVDTEATIQASENSAGVQGVRWATQSGPLLLQAGTIHQKFTQGSANKAIRSGVGIVSPLEVCFVLSEQPVNFYDFAHFFKTTLHCQDALYLDGAISKFYAPEIGLTDQGGDFAGIFAIVE